MSLLGIALWAGPVFGLIVVAVSLAGYGLLFCLSRRDVPRGDEGGRSDLTGNYPFEGENVRCPN